MHLSVETKKAIAKLNLTSLEIATPNQSSPVIYLLNEERIEFIAKFKKEVSRKRANFNSSLKIPQPNTTVKNILVQVDYPIKRSASWSEQNAITIFWLRGGYYAVQGGFNIFLASYETL